MVGRRGVMVGRERELATLHAAAERARGGAAATAWARWPENAVERPAGP